MSSSKTSLFLPLFMLTGIGLAHVMMFLQNDLFNTASARMISLPHAEISQNWYTNSKSRPYAKLAVLYNAQQHRERRYYEVQCSTALQALCDLSYRHTNVKFHAQNVVLVQIDLPNETDFIVQGDFYLADKKLASMQSSRKKILKKIQNIRRSQRIFSIVLVIDMIILLGLIIWCLHSMISQKYKK